jgi:tripartite-type tricarboxylate transporter receptor subunit TctC
MKKLILTALLALSTAVLAQSNTIKIVVPYPPGGPTDVMSRSIQKELSASMKKNVIVENHPGASTAIGATLVANANYNETVLLVNTSTTYINLMTKKSIGHNEHQLVPLVYLGNCPTVLIVSPKLGIKNFNEFKKLNIGRPLNFGSSGVGSTSSFQAVHLQKYLNKDYTEIPYKGASPIMVDLISGNIDFAFVNYTTALPFIESKKVVPIAIYANHQVKELPNVPDYTKLGIPYPGDINWYMIWSNQNINFDDQRKIQEIMTRVSTDPDKIKVFKDQGLTMSPKTIIPTKEFVIKFKSDTSKLLEYVGYRAQE